MEAIGWERGMTLAIGVDKREGGSFTTSFIERIEISGTITDP